MMEVHEVLSPTGLQGTILTRIVLELGQDRSGFHAAQDLLGKFFQASRPKSFHKVRSKPDPKSSLAQCPNGPDLKHGTLELIKEVVIDVVSYIKVVVALLDPNKGADRFGLELPLVLKHLVGMHDAWRSPFCPLAGAYRPRSWYSSSPSQCLCHYHCRCQGASTMRTSTSTMVLASHVSPKLKPKP